MTAERKLESAWRSDLEMLTDEVEHLHGVAPPDRYAAGNEEGRYRTLYRLLHTLSEQDDRAALCLSGGGIRSATFGLGVLQGLAHRGHLARFHYLSTVSGGGYIGSWLSSWIHRRSQGGATADQARDQVIAQLAAVTAGQTVEPAPVRRLRAYSNYLSPVRGLSGDALALLATYLRNLWLNWLVLVPLILAVLMLPRVLVILTLLQDVQPWCWGAAAVIAVLSLICSIAYIASDLPPTPTTNGLPSTPPILRRPTWDNVFWLCSTPLLVATLCVSMLGAWISRGTGQPADWMLGVAHRFGALMDWLASVASCRFLSEPSTQTVAGLAVAAAMLYVIAAAVGHFILRPWRNAVPKSREVKWTTLLGIPVIGAFCGVLLGLLFVWLPNQWPLRLATEHDQFVGWYATSAVPALMAIFWLGATIYAAWDRKHGSSDDREWWARATGSWLYSAGAWLLLSLLVVQLPPLLLKMTWLDAASSPGAVGIGAALLGLLTSAAGYWSRHGPALQKRADTIAAALGLRVLELAAAAFLILLALGLTLGIAQVQLAWVPGLESRAKVAEQSVEKQALEDDKKAYARANPTKEPPNYWSCAPRDEAKKPDERSVAGECAGWAERLAAGYRVSIFGLYPVERPADQGWFYATPLLYLVAALVLLLAVSAIVSWRIGTNAFSLHDMYGNRLVRAYLGTTRDDDERHPHWYTGFDLADNLAMDALPGAERTNPAERRPRLFHVVNTALNLVAPSDKRREWQERKAASFTVTPRHAGSRPTGYVPSWLYANTSGNVTDAALPTAPGSGGISLGRALTISGAAASPNMGYHSSKLVAMVMGFFNIRLGAWMPNPKPEFADAWTTSEPKFSLDTSLDELMAKTSDDTKFVNLSDGGHFENLGLYEMVRRRVKHIVVVDATCDPKYEFADLEDAMRKIRVDLGIELHFPDGLPGPTECGRNGHAIAVGDIHYRAADSDAPDGKLYYLKPVLLDDLPLDVESYAASTRRKSRGGPFPQQSTSDQFFEETQFESYRHLGLHCVLKSFPPDGVWPDSPRRRTRPGAALRDADDPRIGVAAPPAAQTLLERASQMAQSVRPDALLASLAVVGAVGVTATMSLSNPTVTLAPGATVGIDPSGLSKLPVVISGPEVADATRELLNLKEQVEATARRLQGTDDSDPGLIRQLRDMSKDLATILDSKLPTQVAAVASQASQAAAALETFRKALPTEGSLKGFPEAAAKIASASAALEVAAAKLGDAADKTVRLDETQAKAVAEAASAIVDIRNRVSELPPRRNLRGTTEGSKP